MSPTKAIALGIFLNVITVIGLERVKHLWSDARPAFAAEPWLWYAVIAVTIVATQFCIIQAGLTAGFPMHVGIGILIAFVLTAATLIGCRTSGRWPTLAETTCLLTLIAAAFLFQWVSSNADKAHHDQLKATTRDRDA